MFRCVTTRLPAALAAALFQAVYLGMTYALLSLLAGYLGSLLALPRD